MGRKARPLQTNIVAGECDPKLRARNDVKQYYQGVFYGRNVFVIPQGGMKRRPGLVKADMLGAPPVLAKFITFKFSVQEKYLMFVTDGDCAIYKDGVLMVHVALPYNASQIRELTWTQSLDTLLLFHPDIQTRRLMRQGSDTSWLLTTQQFTHIPSYYFERETDVNVTMNTSAATTATAAGPIFTPADVGRYIRGGGGYSKITVFTSSTVVTVQTRTNYVDLTIDAGAWTIEEDAWSDTRGWPSCGTFHQNRLILGGSRQRPQTIWGSRTGLFFDFDATSLLDDYGFESTADSDTVSAIQSIYSGRHLVFFTTDAEFYVPVDDDPLVPKNQWMKRATRRGSVSLDPNQELFRLPVVEVDGGLLFLQSGGKAVREFLWDDAQSDYNAQNISLLSSHLLSQPIDFALRKATNTEESDLVLIVNNDGTLTTLCTLREQSITAWTMCHTDGRFRNVGIDGDRMYFLIEREIDGVTQAFIEYFDDSYFLDCARRVVPVVPTTVVSGYEYLNGQEVSVRVDGVNQDNVTPIGGNVTLATEAESSVEVGFDFPMIEVKKPGERNGEMVRTPFIRTLPIIVPLQDGSFVGEQKGIPEIVVQFYETQNATVQGQRCEFKQYDVDQYDSAARLFTGDYMLDGLLGYDAYGMIDITQDAPGPWMILGIRAKVDFV
jgi:hypothetical protein